MHWPISQLLHTMYVGFSCPKNSYEGNPQFGNLVCLLYKQNQSSLIFHKPSSDISTIELHGITNIENVSFVLFTNKIGSPDNVYNTPDMTDLRCSQQSLQLLGLCLVRRLAYQFSCKTFLSEQSILLKCPQQHLQTIHVCQLCA